MYSIGYDIGTNSVGWAVVNEEGKLDRFKDRKMWGSIISFQDSNTNKPEKRRMFRGARRRLARKKQRIQWLQELMATMVAEADKDFFKKLKYSYLSEKDDNFDYLNPIHADRGAYESVFKMQDYPTIFHLRKALITGEKADIRLIYLALHHIVSERGNFLYEGQKIGLKNLDIRQDIEVLFDYLEFTDLLSPSDIEKIIDEKNGRTSDKQKAIAQYLVDKTTDAIEDSKKYSSEIAKLILGMNANLRNIFNLDDNLKFSLANENADTSALDSDQEFIIELARKVYSGILLKKILKGEGISTISDCYIQRYENHGKDLSSLKRLIRRYFDSSENNIYKEVINATGEKTISYEMYLKHPGKCKLDDLIKELKKKVFEPISDKASTDPDYIYCISRIEEGDFLLKPKNNQNGAIPNQLHVEEMEAIIDHQGQYYPHLLELKEKLLAIASFRIPYFVGPLQTKVYKNGESTDNEFAWVVRGKEKITPWNFKDVVDLDASEERFIRRMTNKCSEIHSDDVLPRHSIIYQEFCVLNELAHIKADGRRLHHSVKIAALTDLFAKTKKVTRRQFVEWLKINNFIDSESPVIEGLSDQTKFQNNLSSFIDFSNILGDDFDIEKVEKMILLLTVSSSKERIVERLSKDFPELNNLQIKRISNLRCSGWGKLGRKVLTGIYYIDREGVSHSILDLMRTTEMNFMEIKFSSEYGFKSQIDELNDKAAQSVSLDEFIQNYPCPPAVRKMARVTLRSLEEIIKVKGGELPEDIYLENSCSEGKKGKKTSSRYSQLEKLYRNLSNNDEYNEIRKKLKEYGTDSRKKQLDDRKLFLYFLQNGKCLYTGKPIDINNLQEGQIDHIVPQSVIKDNSLNNTVLVLSKENQRKGDDLTLRDDIIDARKTWWKSLLDAGLMSNEKFTNLTRKEMKDEDFERFVNRQLVETQQIIQIVKDLIRMFFPGVHIYGVSAKLSSNIRAMNHFTKVRELNDYHHAEDAYLAARIGFFIQKRFSLTNGMVKAEYRTAIKENPDNKYGLIASYFSRRLPYWNGFMEINELRHNLNSLDHFINYLTEENTDEFYNQTKEPKKEGLIPLSKNRMNTKLYGGYAGENDAYFLLVKYRKGKKYVLKLSGIPIRITVLGEKAVKDFLKEKFGDTVEIAADRKIKKYQSILIPGTEGRKAQELMIVGEKEEINARQLVLKKQSLETLNKVINRKTTDTTDTFQIRQDMLLLYDDLIRKLKDYTCYEKIYDILLTKRTELLELDNEALAKMIKCLITAMKADARRIEVTDWPIKGLPTTRMTKVLDPEKMVFIDRSITGMFEKKTSYGV